MFGQKSSRLHGVRVRCRLESIREMYRPSIYSRLSAALAVPADGSHLAVSGESAETTDGFAAIRRRETTIYCDCSSRSTLLLALARRQTHETMKNHVTVCCTGRSCRRGGGGEKGVKRKIIFSSYRRASLMGS